MRPRPRLRLRRLLIGAAIALAMPAAIPGARAVQPDEIMADPAQETRARGLSRELRCMVCQNQSIDDSDAALARDLRLLVRERIAAGDSDAQVIDFLVARYGEFVLLKPRFESRTWLLWGMPPALLLGGGLVLWRQLRRREASGTSRAPLTPEEEARLQSLVGGEQPPTTA